MYKYLLIVLSLYGCTGKDYPVEPNQIPAGTVGKLYNQKIDVSGGVVIPYTVQMTTDFKEDMGVVVKPINQDVSDVYNHLFVGFQNIVVILKLKSLVEYMVVVMENLQRNILTRLILNKIFQRFINNL